MLPRALSTWRTRASTPSSGVRCRQWSLIVRRGYADDGSYDTPSDWLDISRQAQDEGLVVDKKPGVLLGSATTDNAQGTSIAQLLEQIKPQLCPKETDMPQKPALLALLLTPSFAQHALNGKAPVQVLQRLHPGEGTALTKPLDVVTAVVDRLPSPTEPGAGREGLAYMFLRNPEPLSIASQTGLNPSAQKAGSLSFEVPTTTTRPWNYTVQLPLAQTIFSTGLVSTLVHSRYSYSATDGLVKGSERHLESQTLRLPLDAHYGVLALHTPLVPLTPFRVVRNLMGNIVRTLSSATAREDSSNKPSEKSDPQPASQELEYAVSSYFEAKHMAPEPVNVWALILPDPGAPWSRFKSEQHSQRTMRKITPEKIRGIWTGEKDQRGTLGSLDSAALRFFRNGGGRLCRVLSGGGGWGKKAGLLSLDPDSVYSSRELRADQGWEFDFDDESVGAAERQQKQALGEVVKEGESIMFFLAPKGFHRTETADQSMEFVRKADNAALFGVIPSTVDAIPGTLSEHTDGSSTNSANSPGISHHPGLFGALSETGMALTVSREERVISQTKFDAPFSHVRITENIADVDTIREVGEREQIRRAESKMKAGVTLSEHYFQTAERTITGTTGNNNAEPQKFRRVTTHTVSKTDGMRTTADQISPPTGKGRQNDGAYVAQKWRRQARDNEQPLVRDVDFGPAPLRPRVALGGTEKHFDFQRKRDYSTDARPTASTDVGASDE